MDKATFTARSERLLEIAKLLEKLPSEIRSQAFALVSAYVGGKAAAAEKTEDDDDDDAGGDTTDRETFFAGFTHDKPADNVKLIAAWWYSQHGNAVLSLDGLRALATDVGLTIPDRPVETLRQAAQEGKLLFKPAGRGKWGPTVHGEAYLKTTYKVKKGKKPVAVAEKK
jgi:hypothetical protein